MCAFQEEIITVIKCEALVSKWSNKTYVNLPLLYITPLNRSKSVRILFNFYVIFPQNGKSGTSNQVIQFSHKPKKNVIYMESCCTHRKS